MRLLRDKAVNCDLKPVRLKRSPMFDRLLGAVKMFTFAVTQQRAACRRLASVCVTRAVLTSRVDTPSVGQSWTLSGFPVVVLRSSATVVPVNPGT